MSQPSLPTNRAFVVQFRAQTAEAPLSWEGRIEHLVSGQVGRFHSPEELLEFLDRMLATVQEPSET
jgi:hypothetical protein